MGKTRPLSAVAARVPDTDDTDTFTCTHGVAVGASAAAGMWWRNRVCLRHGVRRTPTNVRRLRKTARGCKEVQGGCTLDHADATPAVGRRWPRGVSDVGTARAPPAPPHTNYTDVCVRVCVDGAAIANAAPWRTAPRHGRVRRRPGPDPEARTSAGQAGPGTAARSRGGRVGGSSSARRQHHNKARRLRSAWWQ